MESVQYQTNQDTNNRLKKPIKSFVNKYGIYSSLVMVSLLFVVLTKGGILAASNLKVILNQTFGIMIGAIGALFVFAHGGFDMSLGAVQALAMLVIVVILKESVALWPIALTAGLCIGVFCAVTNGWVSRKLGIPVFAVSLCMRYIASGIVSTATSSSNYYVPLDFMKFDSIWIKILALALVIGAGYYLFEHTRVGRFQKAMGGNNKAARLAGVNTNLQVVVACAILGTCIGIMAFTSTARLGSVGSSTGQAMNCRQQNGVLFVGDIQISLVHHTKVIWSIWRLSLMQHGHSWRVMQPKMLRLHMIHWYNKELMEFYPYLLLPTVLNNVRKPAYFLVCIATLLVTRSYWQHVTNQMYGLVQILRMILNVEKLCLARCMKKAAERYWRWLLLQWEVMVIMIEDGMVLWRKRKNTET